MRKYLIRVPHELHMLHEGQTEALALGFMAYCETISIIQYNHLSLVFMFKVNLTTNPIKIKKHKLLYYLRILNLFVNQRKIRLRAYHPSITTQSLE